MGLNIKYTEQMNVQHALIMTYVHQKTKEQ